MPAKLRAVLATFGFSENCIAGSAHYLTNNIVIHCQNVNPDGSLVNDNACIDNTAESNHNTMKVHIHSLVLITESVCGIEEGCIQHSCLGDRISSILCTRTIGRIILFFQSSWCEPFYSSHRLGANHHIIPIVLVQIILFFQSSWCKSSYSSNRPAVQNSYCDKELKQFCPPSSSDDFCLLFCINPSSNGVRRQTSTCLQSCQLLWHCFYIVMASRDTVRSNFFGSKQLITVDTVQYSTCLCC